MLSVSKMHFMLSVITLNVVILSAAAPPYPACQIWSRPTPSAPRRIWAFPSDHPTDDACRVPCNPPPPDRR